MPEVASGQFGLLKWTALILVFFSFALPAKGIDQITYYEDALNWAVSEGIVDDISREFNDDYDEYVWFRPDDVVNRAEMAKMIVKVLGIEVETGLGRRFLDVRESAWHYDVIHTGEKMGLFDGYTDAQGVQSGFFGPADPVTRASAAKVLTLAYDYEFETCSKRFVDVDYDFWYAPFIDSMCAADIMRGGDDGLMRPGDTVTRAEFITMLYRAAGEPEGLEVTPQPGIAPEFDIDAVPTLPPTLNVSLIDSQPFMLPRDAAGVVFATLELKAEGADIVVDGVTVHRTGVGSYRDFSEIWLSVDGFRVGPTRNINSNNVAEISLGADSILIPMGETVQISIKGSFSETAGVNTQHKLGISSQSDIRAHVNNLPNESPEIEGDFPEFGASATVESATDFPDFDSQVYNNFARLRAPTGKCPDGSCAVHVAQFAVTTTFDGVTLRGLTFRNDDNAENFNGRFGTFFLVHDGRVIDTASFTDSGGNEDGTVEFGGFSYTLSKGKRHKLNVLAEIHDVQNAEQSGSFIKLYVENSGAIDGISATNGNSIGANNISITAGPTGDYIQTHIVRKSYPIIEDDNGGTVARIFSSLDSTKVYRFKMSAHPRGDMEWSKLTFAVNETAGISSSNYKLYVDNSMTALNTPTNPVSGKVVIIPTNPVRIPAGQTVTFVLKADVDLTDTVQSQNLSLTLTAASDVARATSAAAALSGGDFVWSDLSAKNHSLTTPDWTNGFEVDTLDFETINIGYEGTGS